MEHDETGGKAWPVAWSAAWIGALTALCLALVIGLVGYAAGAHEVARAASWRNVRLITLVFNIGGAFFSFVAGGWVACRIAGFRRAEPAMLHGGIVWLVAVPLLLGLAALGAAHHIGGWYGGLAWPGTGGTAGLAGESAAIAIRNAALGSAVALLLGLAGAVLGAWMGSGEPMTLGHYRRRPRLSDEERPRRVA
jgi:hypothetical protein